MPAWKKINKVISALIGAVFLILFSTKVWAAMQLSFSNAPTEIYGDNWFEVNVSLTDAPKETTYYLRAALYETGKTSYFGYTWNHLGKWHNAPSEATKFLAITTSPEGSWSGQLRAKADLDSSYFKGKGEYQFKVGRYTSSGNFGSWSDNTTIMIEYMESPSPTPNPSPSPTPAPNPTATETPSSPSSTPLVQISSSPTPRAIIDESSESEVLSTDSKLMLGTISGEILGETKETTKSSTTVNPYQLSVWLVMVGLGLVGLATWLWFRV